MFKRELTFSLFLGFLLLFAIKYYAYADTSSFIHLFHFSGFLKSERRKGINFLLLNHLFGVDARFMTIQPINAEDKYFKELNGTVKKVFILSLTRFYFSIINFPFFLFTFDFYNFFLL